MEDKFYIEITDENKDSLQTFYENNIHLYPRCRKEWSIGSISHIFLIPGGDRCHTTYEGSNELKGRIKINNLSEIHFLNSPKIEITPKPDDYTYLKTLLKQIK